MRVLAAAFDAARTGGRRRRRRMLLTALGIALAAAMLSGAVVVAVGLGGGFERAARSAQLPDVIVRFDDESAQRVIDRIAALPDVAGYQLRLEVTNTEIAARGRFRSDAVAEVVSHATRRGYAIAAGRDLRARGSGVLVERAFADAWHLGVGSRLFVEGLGSQPVVGLVEAPDNVGFPLAKPRYYLSRSALQARFGREVNPRVNLVEIWLRNPRYLSEVLVQARSTSFGLRDLRFATRGGIRVLLDQAAGIVIDLLVALSAIALLTAAVMLAASARAEVQRRLGTIGVWRAIGATRTHVVLTLVVETLLVAVPASVVGLVAGVLATAGSTDRLLTLLNEPPAGGALIVPLAAAFLGSVAIPVVGAAWPAWTAANRSPVGLLRGADVTGGSRATRRARAAGAARSVRGGPVALGGLTGLGARLVGARRARLTATVVMLALSAAFVLLMVSLASELSTLETDPGALGKRYQLTAALPPDRVGDVRRIAGVQAVAPRYQVQAADSYSLGETINVIAYPGDHTTFEAPPLTHGHRLRGPRQAEVGAGLADALGLDVGSPLALALPGGAELRLRVAGIVSSLDHDGRVAYVPAAALLGANPSAPSRLAVRVRPNANTGRVFAALSGLGGEPASPTGATARGAPLVDVLRTILIALAIIDGLVCTYALVQACALTVQERRRTVAVLRACGASAGGVRRLLIGAVLALVVPAAVIGVAFERLVLGPALSRLAESYATLPLDATAPQVTAVVAGLLAAGAVAVLWVAAQAQREPIVTGLAA